MSIRLFILTSILVSSLTACSSAPVANDASPATKETATTTENNDTSENKTQQQASGSSDEVQPNGEEKPSYAVDLSKTQLKSPWAEDEAAIDPEDKDVHCKKPGDERWLQIEPLEETGCKLWYTKDIGKKAVAWSSSSKVHCRKARDKMVNRLEGTGFACTSEQ